MEELQLTSEEQERLENFDEEAFKKDIDEKLDKMMSLFQPRNRAERRAMKKKKKNVPELTDDVREQIKKATYVEAIQRMRKLNEEKEKEQQ